MDKTVAAILLTVGLSAVGVWGDYFLKLASRSENGFGSRVFLIGLALYACTAFGWVIALRHLKLATVGSIYCVTTVLFLTVVGRLSFAESLSYPEMIGVGLGLASFFLLFRFS